ncbi:MAG: endonuclease/exonuclease/phosphatase family protein [Bacteroidales bacterium]|jgi:endonuclease/exonuclease/phosphatase family metal-dependent hydrolase
MTLNIRYDNPGDSTNSWPKRASMVCSFIRSERPDVLGLQEVLVNQYDVLATYLKDYGSAAVGRTDGAREGEMNPVFFRKDRFDMVRTKTFWLSETPEMPGSVSWGSSLPRIVTWMELVNKKSHKHFYIFNTHFAHDSDSARILSSELVLHRIDSLASGFPFIMTGDFNMLPTSRGYSILTGPAESVPLLDDSFKITEKKPGGPGYTFNGFSNKTCTDRVDYIFVRDGMRVLEHNTIIKKDRRVYISDHWPVEAVISLK